MWEFGEEEGVSAIYCLLGGKISASAWGAYVAACGLFLAYFSQLNSTQFFFNFILTIFLNSIQPN